MVPPVPNARGRLRLRSAPPANLKQYFKVKAPRNTVKPLPGPAPSQAVSSPALAGPSGARPRRRPPPRPRDVASLQVAKKHDCRLCSKKFCSPGKLSQHMLSHTGELPFACQNCDKKFNSKFKLVRHGLIHNKTRPFACSKCERTFHRKDHLSNHERVHDPLKNVYTCSRDACRKRYTSQLSFKKHVALHMAEEGSLSCDICKKVFSTRAEIVHHLKVHAGSRSVKNEDDKKFPCLECDKKFFTNKDVRRHSVVHSKSRDFLCQICPQKFGRKDHLVRHMKKAHPDSDWESATPGTSTSNVGMVPLSPVTKKTKGPDVKKTKTKAELKLVRRSPPGTEIRSERLKNLERSKASLATDKFVYSMHQDVSVKPETAATTENIKIEEERNVLFSNPQQTNENLIIYDTFPAVDVMPSTSVIADFSAFITGLPMMIDESVEFCNEPVSEESLNVGVADASSGDMMVLDSVPSDMEWFQMPGSVSLPAFEDTFQNKAQSPKPPLPPK